MFSLLQSDEDEAEPVKKRAGSQVSSFGDVVNVKCVHCALPHCEMSGASAGSCESRTVCCICVELIYQLVPSL